MKTLTITVKAVQTRFGTLFQADNNYGEPKGGEIRAFKTEEEAIDNELRELGAGRSDFSESVVIEGDVFILKTETLS